MTSSNLKIEKAFNFSNAFYSHSYFAEGIIGWGPLFGSISPTPFSPLLTPLLAFLLYVYQKMLAYAIWRERGASAEKDESKEIRGLFQNIPFVVTMCFVRLASYFFLIGNWQKSYVRQAIVSNSLESEVFEKNAL